MADSLRDQLLKSGLVQKLKVDVTPPAPARGTHANQRPRQGDARGAGARGDAPRVDRAAGERRDRPNPARGDRPGHGPQTPRGADARRGQSLGTPRPARDRPAGETGSAELDLARAYALRARDEKQQREQAERANAEIARQKKERKQKLVQLLEGKSRNDAGAEQPRHFTHGSKIRRIYCTPQQLEALNRGELGVVQNTGRYLLVDRDVALAAQALDADSLVLLPDPNAVADDDIPADLMW